MAKVHLSRLAKKYDIDPSEIKGKNYQKLMQDILARNTKNVSESTAKLSDEHWSKSLKKISKKEKRFIMPDVSEVIPNDGIFMKKSADQGQLITNTLRNKLSEDLKQTLEEFKTAKTGEQAFIRRRGTQAGTINPKVIDSFQAKIVETFDAYTKKDPRFGIPANVKTIATTEVRSAINEVKDTYAKQLIAKNPNVKMRKKWKQNKQLAKKPRTGHSMVNNKVVDFNEKFKVPLIIGGIRLGTTAMDRPHDPNAPLEQVIGCNCDIEHYAEIINE